MNIVSSCRTKKKINNYQDLSAYLTDAALQRRSQKATEVTLTRGMNFTHNLAHNKNKVKFGNMPSLLLTSNTKLNGTL